MSVAFRERIATLEDARVAFWADIVERSGVARHIDGLHAVHTAKALRSRGISATVKTLDRWPRYGRPELGITFTMKGYLTGLCLQLELRRPPSTAGVFELVTRWMTPRQRSMVGICIDAEELDRLNDPAHYALQAKRNIDWLSRSVRWMDSNPDLPARRTTQKVKRDTIANRTLEQRTASRVAARHARLIMNRWIAASIFQKPDYHNLVADETIWDTTKVAAGMGHKHHKRRGASPVSELYVRTRVIEDSHGRLGADGRGNPRSGSPSVKIGIGTGMTAIGPVPDPGDMRTAPPLITAIDVNGPTSGSVEAVENALAHHHLFGFGKRRELDSPHNEKQPMFATDMGYHPKRGWAEMLYRRGYTWIGDIPEGTSVRSPAVNPTVKLGLAQPGPHFYTCFYCPFAELLLQRDDLIPQSDRTGRNEFSGDMIAQDRRFKELHPLLMGLNSRIKKTRAATGRPRKDQPKPTEVEKIELVCPATQLRCRCPLKPESLTKAPPTVPLIAPNWTADKYRSCSQSSVTVTLTPDQFRYYQALPIASWEHATILRAYRAANERMFAFLKSDAFTGLASLNFGARRDPILKLTLAAAVVVSNVKLQQGGSPPQAIDSITERLGRVDQIVGGRAKLPPRT